MKINDHLTIEPVFDYKHGRRFQILVSNPTKGENFTVHRDMMAREYVKIKLSDADIFKLIVELKKSMTDPNFDPKSAETAARRAHLKLVKGKSEE